MADYSMRSLRPAERVLARAWLASAERPQERVYYNVRLGFGLEAPLGSAPWEKRLIASLTRRRADVVARHEQCVTLVELKERAGLAALGQLLGYGVLFLDFVRRREVYTARLGLDDRDLMALRDVTSTLVLSGWSSGMADPVVFMRRFPGLLRLVCVCHRVAPDMEWLYGLLGVEVTLV